MVGCIKYFLWRTLNTILVGDVATFNGNIMSGPVVGEGRQSRAIVDGDWEGVSVSGHHHMIQE